MENFKSEEDKIRELMNFSEGYDPLFEDVNKVLFKSSSFDWDICIN